MVWQEYFAQVLGESLEAAKQRNHRLSLRGVSQRFGVAPGMLSEIIRGRRHVSWERAMEIAENAKFTAAELQRLNKLNKLEAKKKPRFVLKDGAVDLILNPIYYRVLCAFEILPAPVTEDALANFLDADAVKVAEVLSTLISFELVEIKGDEYIWSGKHVSTSSKMGSAKIQNFFREDLADAAKALAVPAEQREYTTVTFSGNASELEGAKKHIREFRDSLSDKMNVEPNQIYQLSIQLRPVSKIFEQGSPQ